MIYERRYLEAMAQRVLVHGGVMGCRHCKA